MTGYYEPEIKATNIKKIRTLLYKMDIKNMERIFSKAREKKLIKDY